MNPEQNVPQPNFEQAPPRTEVEAFPQHPEFVAERQQEREPGTAQSDRQAPPPPVVVPMPPSPVVPLPQQPIVDDSAGPTIAADDDLIEKEWVDKAKRIILDTKDDPYKREQEVARLQADYLRKRYGKELGASE